VAIRKVTIVMMDLLRLSYLDAVARVLATFGAATAMVAASSITASHRKCSV